MVDLKPCPFCGGEAEIVTLDNWYINSPVGVGWPVGVGCSQCPVIIAEFGEYKRFTTEAEAIAAWNTRAERTCRNLEKRNSNLWFVCSKCGANSGNGTYSEEWMHQDHTDEECAEYNGEPFNYCPNCGVKVVGE